MIRNPYAKKPPPSTTAVVANDNHRVQSDRTHSAARASTVAIATSATATSTTATARTSTPLNRPLEILQRVPCNTSAVVVVDAVKTTAPIAVTMTTMTTAPNLSQPPQPQPQPPQPTTVTAANQTTIRNRYSITQQASSRRMMDSNGGALTNALQQKLHPTNDIIDLTSTTTTTTATTTTISALSNRHTIGSSTGSSASKLPPMYQYAVHRTVHGAPPSQLPLPLPPQTLNQRPSSSSSSASTTTTVASSQLSQSSQLQLLWNNSHTNHQNNHPNMNHHAAKRNDDDDSDVDRNNMKKKSSVTTALMLDRYHNTLPPEIRFTSNDKVTQPIQDEYRTDLVKNAALSEPLRNGWSLYSHQKRAILVSLLMRRHILALDMGLGKTVIGCCWARAFVRTIPNLRVIIICPVSLKEEWQRTAQDIVGLSIHADSDTNPKPRKKAKVQDRTDENTHEVGSGTEGVVTIASWAKVPHPDDVLIANRNRNHPYVVVADEAHSMQSMNSARTRDALHLMLAPNAVGVLLLTGTPVCLFLCLLDYFCVVSCNSID
jgi:SNF2-related domain